MAHRTRKPVKRQIPSGDDLGDALTSLNRWKISNHIQDTIDEWADALRAAAAHPDCEYKHLEKALSDAYWGYNGDSLSTRLKAIAKEVLPYKWIPSGRADIFDCRGCGADVEVISFSWTAHDHVYAECESCQDRRRNADAAWREEYKRRNQEHADEVRRLRALPYAEYLKSDHWQYIRKRALGRAHYRCQLCNKDNTRLDVHHRTYERLGDELLSDLFVFCRGCHKTHHGIEDAPPAPIEQGDF